MCGISANFFNVSSFEDGRLPDVLRMAMYLNETHQDDRGRDNAGTVFEVEDPDKQKFLYTYWGDPSKKEKKLEDIATTDDLFEHEGVQYFKTYRKTISHSRHGSSGGSFNYDNAHPFIIDNKFVGVHNGTLRGDWKSLFSNYADIKGIDCDSEALLKCVYEDGYEILSNYEGAATLVWTTVDEDALYAFSGKSLYSKYARGMKSVQVEREFHYLELPNNWGWMFSSTPEVLDVVANTLNIEEAKQLPPNKVWKFSSEGMEEVAEVKRPLEEPKPEPKKPEPKPEQKKLPLSTQTIKEVSPKSTLFEMKSFNYNHIFKTYAEFNRVFSWRFKVDAANVDLTNAEMYFSKPLMRGNTLNLITKHRLHYTVKFSCEVGIYSRVATIMSNFDIVANQDGTFSIKSNTNCYYIVASNLNFVFIGIPPRKGFTYSMTKFFMGIRITHQMNLVLLKASESKFKTKSDLLTHFMNLINTRANAYVQL